MTLTAPLGLLGFLAVPLIVFLHAFRNRLKQKPVAGLFLFPETAVSSDGGRTRSRIWSSSSLWLECAAAVLLSLWLAGLTFGELAPRHVVLVVDDSASMQATPMRDRAVAAIEAVCEGCASNDELTVVLSGKPARVVVGPGAQAKQVADWLTLWSPALPGHSLSPALDLGRELAGQAGELVLVTDELPGAVGEDLRLVCCGVAVPNAAIASLQRLPGADRDRVLVTVVGYGQIAPFDAVVFGDGEELASVPMALPAAGGDAQFALSVAKDVLQLRVELPDDALVLDNVAWHLAEPRRVVSVCDQLSARQRRALALPRVLEAMSDWRQESDPQRAQIVLCSKPRPSSIDPDGRMPSGQIEVVVAASAGDRRGHLSPFVVDRSHALLAGLEFDGVAWQSGSGDVPGRVLVAQVSKVLLSEELTDTGRRLWIDLDPSAGNFVRAPDWPILFANLFDAARREVPGLQQHQLRVGDELVFRMGRDRREVVLVGPARPGESAGPLLAESVAAATVGAFGSGIRHLVTQPGLHRVQTRAGERLAEVAVQFVDARESDLRRCRSLEREPAEATREAIVARVDAGPTRRLLALLLLGVLLSNWWFLRRRHA